MVIIAGFLLLTLPLMPAQATFNAMWPAMARRFPHWYHKALARLMGVHVNVSGVPPRGGPTLLVGNHVSWLDIVVLSAAHPLSFIAKKEVAGWPLFGLMAKLQRTVFVDRERRTKTVHVRNGIAERLGRGDTLVLFPEGTSNDGRQILPFKSALFGVAEGADVPVVPLTIAYTHRNGLPMTRRQRPGCAWYGDMDLTPHLWELVQSGPISVVVAFHEPLAPGADRKAHAQQAETMIRAKLADILHAPPKFR